MQLNDSNALDNMHLFSVKPETITTELKYALQTKNKRPKKIQWKKCAQQTLTYRTIYYYVRSERNTRKD